MNAEVALAIICNGLVAVTYQIEEAFNLMLSRLLVQSCCPPTMRELSWLRLNMLQLDLIALHLICFSYLRIACSTIVSRLCQALKILRIKEWLW